MSINFKQYTENKKTNTKLITGLKATKDFNKFLYQPRIDGKLARHTFDLSSLNLNKTDRINKAVEKALSFKQNKELNSDKEINQDTKLDTLVSVYFKHQDDTEWNQQRKRQYELYIQNEIGSKALGKITLLNLDEIKSNMETKGYTKQNSNGCSNRTIHKVFMQVLKPILQYSIDINAIDNLPKFPTIKKTTTKKIVKNASEKYIAIYNAVMRLYQDDSFYRALFGFALVGRRWNEIATLEWSDIDFDKDEYVIRAENNKIDDDQEYFLPNFIKESLLDLYESSTGLIFKSPKTGKKLHSPKRQLERVKKESGVEELTMHLFRHLYVSALSKMGVDSSRLSDALGHTDSRTLDKHYRTADRVIASKQTTLEMERLYNGE